MAGAPPLAPVKAPSSETATIVAVPARPAEQNPEAAAPEIKVPSASEPAAPEYAKPKPAQCDAAQPDVAQTDVAQPDAAKPGPTPTSAVTGLEDTATPETSAAPAAAPKPNFWADEPDRDAYLPAYEPPAADELVPAESTSDLQLDRASAGALLGSAFFAFPALAVLAAGLALGYGAGAMLGIFVLVAVPLGVIGSLIVGLTTWRTLRRWPIEPAPPEAGMSTLPPIKLHTGLSVLLAGLLITALLLAPPSGSGGAAGGLAGVAGSLALAAYFGALPLRSFERKHWTMLWVDRRAKGLRTFFTTPAAGPSHSASTLRFDEADTDGAGAPLPTEPPESLSQD